MARTGYPMTMWAEIFPRVTVDPTVCFGKPTIRGMRIGVSDVLSMLAGGMSADEILADFPYLEREDIRARPRRPTAGLRLTIEGERGERVTIGRAGTIGDPCGGGGRGS